MKMRSMLQCELFFAMTAVFYGLQIIHFVASSTVDKTDVDQKIHPLVNITNDSKVNFPYNWRCDSRLPVSCKLPDCFCSGSKIPDNLKNTDVPQMIAITFQGPVIESLVAKYIGLFQGRVNPNGCPVTTTFFVQHNNTDYFGVQKLASLRHEIGLNGITSKSLQYDNIDVWSSTLADQKEIIQHFTNVSNIMGVRAPAFAMGGDSQLTAMKSVNIKYDASRISEEKKFLYWPYSYYYLSSQDCVNASCPNNSYKGQWQIPLMSFVHNGKVCHTLDECNLTSPVDVFKLLYSTFVDHYTTNRAPLVLTISPDWMMNKSKLLALEAFLEYLKFHKDVFLVSATQVLDWIQTPQILANIKTFSKWQCSDPSPHVCTENSTETCLYSQNRRSTNLPSAVRYRLRSCERICPKCYPWINDPKGVKC